MTSNLSLLFLIGLATACANDSVAPNPFESDQADELFEGFVQYTDCISSLSSPDSGDANSGARSGGLNVYFTDFDGPINGKLSVMTTQFGDSDRLWLITSSTLYGFPLADLDRQYTEHTYGIKIPTYRFSIGYDLTGDGENETVYYLALTPGGKYTQFTATHEKDGYDYPLLGGDSIQQVRFGDGEPGDILVTGDGELRRNAAKAIMAMPQEYTAEYLQSQISNRASIPKEEYLARIVSCETIDDPLLQDVIEKVKKTFAVVPD